MNVQYRRRGCVLAKPMGLRSKTPKVRLAAHAMVFSVDGRLNVILPQASSHWCSLPWPI